MKTPPVIPSPKGGALVVRLAAILVLAWTASFAGLYLFLSRDLGDSYFRAFGLLAEADRKINGIVLLSVFFQLAFSLFAVYITALRFSHKIAGPMFRLKTVLKSYTGGNPAEAIRFRQDDFLIDFPDVFNGCFAVLAERRRKLEEAEKLAAELDAGEGPERESKIDRIKAIVADLET